MVTLTVRGVMLLESIAYPFLCRTDSWGPITNFLVFNWPLGVSSYPCS